MDLPSARFVFGCQPVIPQHREATELEIALRFRERIVGHPARFDQAAVPMVLLAQHGRIKTRPAILIHLFGSCAVDVDIGAIAQLACCQFPRPLAHAIADVVPADDKVAAGVIHAAYEDVHVWVVGVVVSDRHPVQPRAEVLLHLLHEVARETFQFHLAAALRRDDESERVPILGRPVREPGSVGAVQLTGGIERLRVASIFVDAVALDVIDVPLHRGLRTVARRWLDSGLDCDTLLSMTKTRLDAGTAACVMRLRATGMRRSAAR